MSQTKVKSGLLNFPDQTDFVKLPSGTTAQRPSSPEKGYSRYNTTDNKLEFWNGTVWQQLPGVVAPIITSISYPGDDLAADPAGGQTITITGTDFKAGATVTVDGTTPSVITFVSATEITFTAPAKTAGDYDIVVTNVDGGNATAVDGMTYNGLPSWTTPAGNLGTFPAGSTIPTITLVATELDSGVVSYSVTTGALPTGLTLTGADIDGTVPSPAGQTTYNFSVTASDDENQESTERAFNIVVYIQVTNTVDEVDPFGDSSGIAFYKFDGDATDESGNYDATFNSPSYVSGYFGQACSFTGANRTMTATRSIDASSSYTASGWVKLGGTTGYNCNIFWDIKSGDTPYNGFRLDETLLRLRHFNTSAGNQDINVDISNYVDDWHHYVAVYDSSEGTASIYIDAVQVANSSFAPGENQSSTNQIGGWYTFRTVTYYFDTDALDHVRYFNRALTPLEVESLYQERTVVCGGQADTLDILGDNSCIATYQLNGNANDLSGNYSGTPTDVSYGVGEFDLAGVFNGSSSIVKNASLATNYRGQTNLSLSAWFKTSAASGRLTIMSFSATGDASTDLFLGIDSDTVGFRNISDGSNSLQAENISGSSVRDGNWHHVVFTADSSGNKLYIDGSQITINYDVGSASTAIIMPSDLNQFNIGANQDSSGEQWFMNGSIDQVRIFNKALNSSEVATLYNETACDALACPGTTNTLDILSDGSCVAAYPLDGSPADLSGNYNGVQTDVTYPVGKFDLAGSFGIASRIETSLHFNGTTAQGASLSAWFKGNPDNPFYIAQAKTLNSSGTFLGYIVVGNSTGDYTDESVMVVSRGSSTLAVAVREGHNAYLDNQWHHIVVTSTSTSKNIYIDGQNKAVVLKDGSASTNLEYRDLMIHSDSAFGGSGSIDQVRIFNKALSSAEVTTLYNETACN